MFDKIPEKKLKYFLIIFVNLHFEIRGKVSFAQILREIEKQSLYRNIAHLIC